MFASNRLLPVLRQQLVFSDRPDDMDALADDETLGGAGMAQDGTAELDVQLTIVRKEKARKLGPKVSYASAFPCCLLLIDAMMHQFEKILLFLMKSQVLKAAQDGRLDALLTLVNQGAIVDFKDEARRHVWLQRLWRPQLSPT